MEYHSKLSYASGAMIFCQGAPADIIFWIVKGVVKESCPSPRGNRIMIRLATAGDMIGCADQINEKGQWIRRFEAQALSKCVVAMITRQRVRELLTSLDSATLLEVSERMNSAWSGWVHYYASFLGMSFRERLELMLAQLGRKFGAPDDDGIALTFEPAHGDLAEMIGCSRPMVSRLMTYLIKQGEIARRGRLYILLSGGTIAATIARNTRRGDGAAAGCSRTGRVSIGPASPSGLAFTALDHDAPITRLDLCAARSVADAEN